MEKEDNFKSKFFESVYPPMLVKSDDSTKRKWEQLKDVSFDSIGRVLTCHLLIEHYLNNYLELNSKAGLLNWDSVNLSFSQKIKLVSGDNSLFKKGNSLYEGLIQLNKIRNNIGHNLAYQLNFKDVEVLLKATKVSKNFKKIIKEHPIAIIELFTSITCSYLSGNFSATCDIE